MGEDDDDDDVDFSSLVVDILWMRSDDAEEVEEVEVVTVGM